MNAQQQRSLRRAFLVGWTQGRRPPSDREGAVALARHVMGSLSLCDRTAVLVEAVLNDDDDAAIMKTVSMLLGGLVLLSHRLPNIQRLSVCAQLVDEAEKLTTLPRRDLH